MNLVLNFMTVAPSGSASRSESLRKKDSLGLPRSRARPEFFFVLGPHVEKKILGLPRTRARPGFLFKK